MFSALCVDWVFFCVDKERDFRALEVQWRARRTGTERCTAWPAVGSALTWIFTYFLTDKEQNTKSTRVVKKLNWTHWTLTHWTLDNKIKGVFYFIIFYFVSMKELCFCYFNSLKKPDGYYETINGQRSCSLLWLIQESNSYEPRDRRCN